METPHLDDFSGHGIMPNVEVLEGTLRLCTPIAVDWDLDKAHAE